MAPTASHEVARPERAADDALRLGPWTLGAPLNLGACGIVFEARDEDQDGPPVAVHVPFARLQADAAFREEYLGETASGMAVKVDGLCQVIDGGNNGVVWRVMALCEGWSFATLITRARGRGQPLSPGLAIGVCEEIGETLAVLAASGRVHGRLSPSRVHITPSGEVALCGWTTPNLGPRPSALLNNPTAMAELAPERLDGLNASPATDVYHLALLLVTLLSRGNPFQRVSAERVQRAILSEELSLPETLPASLCAIVERCLRRSTLERPTLEELGMALRAAAAELPPVGPAERVAELQSLTQGLSAQGNPSARAAAESETVALIELLRGPAGSTPVTLLSAAPRPVAAPALVPAAAPQPPRTRPSFVLAGALLILASMGVGAWMNGQFNPTPPVNPAPPPPEVAQAQPVEPAVEPAVEPDVAPAEVTPAVEPAPEEPAVAEVAPSKPEREKRTEPKTTSRAPEPRERVTTPAPAPPPPPTTAAVTPAVTPTVTPAPAPIAAPIAAPSTLSDLDISVSGGRIVVRGVVSGVGQKAAGLLVEDDGVCEYRMKLSRTDLGAGIGSMPVASPLAKRLNVSARDGNTTVTLVCTPGAGQPQLSASATGFTLTFAPK